MTSKMEVTICVHKHKTNFHQTLSHQISTSQPSNLSMICPTLRPCIKSSPLLPIDAANQDQHWANPNATNNTDPIKSWEKGTKNYRARRSAPSHQVSLATVRVLWFKLPRISWRRYILPHTCSISPTHIHLEMPMERSDTCYDIEILMSGAWSEWYTTLDIWWLGVSESSQCACVCEQ